MTDTISRRRMLKTLAIGAGTVVGISAIELQAATAAAAKPAPAAKPAAPAGPPKLDPTEAAAKALGYVPDATKVDAKANPMYKAGSNCSNCVQLQGKAGDAFRPCNLFPGKLVSANGWCKVYAKKA
jgi:hypothetical protein